MGVPPHLWMVLRILLLRVLPAVLALVVLGLGIAWLAGAFHEKILPGERETVTRLRGDQPVYEVFRVTQEHTEETFGTLKAASRTVLASRVLATIEEINVSAGDQVEAGDVLVRLLSEELDKRLRQAEQAHLAATASREEAESALRRATELQQRSPGAITDAEMEELNARMQIALAEELRQQQGVEEAEVLLSYTVIKAPSAGRVIDRLAEPGDTVTPGQSLLVLYDAESLRVEAPVVEGLAVGLRQGQPLDLRIDSLGLDLVGHVDEVVPQAEARSRSLLVKVSLPDSQDLPEGTNLLEGMFARLLIPAGQREYVCLAEAAVRRVGQLEFVDVVTPDDTLERRLIKTGRPGMAGRVEVLSGLEPGDTVVLYGAKPEELPEGVTPVEATAP